MNPEIQIRQIDWARDGDVLIKFDASFSTDRIYRLEIGPLSAQFREEVLSVPIVKRYDMSGIGDAVNDSGLALVAEEGGRIAGLMTVKYEAWNRRAWLTHIYVAAESRGRGIGTRMIGEAIKYAKKLKARALWLETQNFNYPAIRYYRKRGFQFCGFDRSLYDPENVPGEIAIYFCLDL